MRYELTTQVDVPEQVLGDILVTAFDGDHGGSLFWATDVRLSKATEPADPERPWDKQWIEITLRDQDDEGEPTGPDLKVTYGVLVEGMQRCLDIGNFKQEIHQCIFDDGDAGAIDANIADSIVQMGLFNREIYG